MKEWINPLNVGLLAFVLLLGTTGMQRQKSEADAEASVSFDDYTSDAIEPSFNEPIKVTNIDAEDIDAPPEPLDRAEVFASSECTCVDCQCAANAVQAAPQRMVATRVCEGGVCKTVMRPVKAASSVITKRIGVMQNKRPVRKFLSRLFNR